MSNLLKYRHWFN